MAYHFLLFEMTPLDLDLPDMDQNLLTLTPEMAVYGSTAILRFQSLHPNLRCTLVGQNVLVRVSDVSDISAIRKDLLHAIYREKIYTETLSMRQALVEMVRKR